MGSYSNLETWQKITICTTMILGIMLVATGAIIFSKDLLQPGIITMIIGVALLFGCSIFWIIIEYINKKVNKKQNF
ncbi:hypothetical protein NPX79_01745 [Spiroplasma endosymbiont of Anurida maritima]|uniref:hypothetical protein n=1 Tax=Spiroplasma endosymbiont of Anurida maritima TaxID=2967972 RepID=UPI0036D2E1DE